LEFECEMQGTLQHARRRFSDKKRLHALESDTGNVGSTYMRDDVPGPSIKQRKLENRTSSTMNVEQLPSISLKLSSQS